MSQIFSIILFFGVSAFSFIFGNSDFIYYAPQLIALVSIFIIGLYLTKKILSLHLLALLINLIIFSTNGLNSPFFFLIYFLLFFIAFQNPATTTLSYSLFLVLALSNTLNSPISAITLCSLLLVTPMAWFIGRTYLEKLKDDNIITSDETDVLLWHSLKLKTGLYQIIDSASQLLSQPLGPSQKEKVHAIKNSAKDLLHSSEKLTQEIDQASDEN